jgi:Gram-negative bacterial TonB protein C-terminal
MKSVLTSTLILLFTQILMGQSNEVYTEKKDTSVLKMADTPPEYVGGDAELYTFIYQRLRLPNDANMSECTVYVGFVVKEDGSLTDVSVKRGFSKWYNEEAVRVVESMPRWKAGTHDGKVRRVAKVLPIRFKLH